MGRQVRPHPAGQGGLLRPRGAAGAPRHRRRLPRRPGRARRQRPHAPRRELAISAAPRPRPPTTRHEGVTRTIAGVSRQQAGRAKRQARALTAEALAAIRATARIPRPWADGKRRERPERAEQRGNLDVALCAVLRDALLRRSEAAALTWADVEADPDGSGRLTVKHSKTDQTGEGAVLYLSPQTMGDLDRIRPSPADPAASVFGLGPARLGGRVQATQAASAWPRTSSAAPPSPS